MRVLAADVGGTKTALGLYEVDRGEPCRTLQEQILPSVGPSVSALLGEFMPSDPRVDVAVFSVAGPVVDGVCETTNLPWVLSESELSQELGARTVLINDFHAVAVGVSELPASQLRVLQAGKRDPAGVYAVIGAGTGLGEAVALPVGGGIRVLPGEGGHCDFAARDEIELRLARFLSAKGDHLSVERVVSGPAIGSLYDFVVSEGLAPRDSETERRCVGGEARAAVISERAGVDKAAARALELFVSAYGAEAGNLALKVLPRGGVYVAGGIAARLVDQLDWNLFMRSFRAKGRMYELLGSIPVSVVLDPNVGLLGARAYAALL